MSKELQDLIAVGLKYGLDVSTLTEERAREITKISNELKGIYVEKKIPKDQDPKVFCLIFKYRK